MIPQTNCVLPTPPSPSNPSSPACAPLPVAWKRRAEVDEANIINYTRARIRSAKVRDNEDGPSTARSKIDKVRIQPPFSWFCSRVVHSQVDLNHTSNASRLAVSKFGSGDLQSLGGNGFQSVNCGHVKGTMNGAAVGSPEDKEEAEDKAAGIAIVGSE
ncbi:hypothetical protein C8R45DRAFT_935343 [Mycena sanguinolenta]|nr:hypothetical protein C8R45DRAFT_935343 [Mycena sanguinolenta]